MPIWVLDSLPNNKCNPYLYLFITSPNWIILLNLIILFIWLVILNSYMLIPVAFHKKRKKERKDKTKQRRKEKWMIRCERSEWLDVNLFMNVEANTLKLEFVIQTWFCWRTNNDGEMNLKHLAMTVFGIRFLEKQSWKGNFGKQSL